MIARVFGTAFDAHLARLPPCPVGRARRASWVAGNVLASCGLSAVRVGDSPPRGVVGVRAADLTSLLAALAAAPALIDTSTIRPGWRAALSVLGVPVLDEPAAEAIARGATVAVLVPPRRLSVAGGVPIMTVTADTGGYRVRLPPSRGGLLAAA